MAQLQTVSSDHETQRHWVYNSDCVELMRGWKGAFRPDFIFADPPFNIGQNYDTHVDNMPPSQFNAFTRNWVECCAMMLREGGVLAINVPDSMVGLILTTCPLQRIDWVIWHFRFGQCGKTKFIASHTHCLIFRNGDTQHTWNAGDIMVESLRSSKYNDPRTLDSATPGMRVPFDVWDDIPRLTGNSHERIAEHPNQLPVRYLERLILAYTNKDNFVFDPFGGSGTTACAAAIHNRRSVCCDISSKYCDNIIKRINTCKTGV
jgi:site-specific DNA-methyltransferase (adenine-specific)